MSSPHRPPTAARGPSRRPAEKPVQKAFAAGEKAAEQRIYQESVAVIDRIADKKIIHKNKAARHKSRLAAQVKGLSA